MKEIYVRLANTGKYDVFIDGELVGKAYTYQDIIETLRRRLR